MNLHTIRKSLNFTIIASFFFFLLTSFKNSGNEWMPWQSIQDGQQNEVQFSYRISECSDGGSFAFKLRSDYKAKICGKINVYITLTNGRIKELHYTFKDLDAKEMSCPGLYEFCGVQKFNSVKKVLFSVCNSNTTKNTGVSEMNFEKAKKN